MRSHQARKKEHKPELLSPDIFQWGRGLPREGVGAQKFDMSLETREIKLFWRDIPGFCRDIPESFRNKKYLFNFWLLSQIQKTPTPPSSPRTLSTPWLPALQAEVEALQEHKSCLWLKLKSKLKCNAPIPLACL